MYSKILWILSGIILLLQVIVSSSLPLLQGVNRGNLDPFERNLPTCSKLESFEYGNIEKEFHSTFTGKRLNSTFLLFTFEERYRRVCINYRGRPRRCFIRRQSIRSKKPILCLNNTHPQLCGDIYNATKLREHHGGEKFMAVWNWKLNPATCLKFEINYTRESPNDFLYYTSTTFGPDFDWEEIHPNLSQPITIRSGITSPEVALVFVYKSQEEFNLEFRAIILNDDECERRRCLP